METVSRGSEMINNFISGKAQKSKGGLKYPQDDTPIGKYVVISVYDGTLAKSIQAMTDGVTSVTDKLGGKLGSATSKADNGDWVGAAGDVISGGIGAIGGVISAGESAVGEAIEAIGNVGENGVGNAEVNGGSKNFVENIYLPLPNSLQEALSHDFGEEAGWADKLTAGVGALATFSAEISKMTGSRALTYDKNRISMYTSTAFRSISLSWTLVPNNRQEAETIQRIVKSLKKYSSPESVSGKLLLKSPHFFQIKFGNSILNKALQFHEVNIIDISVEYAPGGAMEMTKDDMPKAVNLNITFKDREPKLYEDWDKSAPKAGQEQKPACKG